MIVMKKKKLLSKSTIAIIVMLLTLAVYCVAYMVPAQNELIAMRAEMSVATAEANIYRQYLNDLSPLEADIAAIQAEIDKLNAEAYTNDSNVSFVISDVIQKCKVSLSSVSLQSETTFDGHRVLPINLSMTGQLENILKLISTFENNKEGSYLVRSATIDIAGSNAKATLVIYLCTPNM